jgi:L-alanine-DL-glutamate epimerase-like enolase superfamily enzyme
MVLTITGVDVFKLDIPLRRPFEIALGRIDTVRNILVRIRASDGTYGLGECSPLRYVTGETQATAFEVARALGQVLLGQDPLAVEVRMQELDRFITGNPTVKSALDLALYDLAAKQAGLPLYALLGGEKRELWTDDTIGIDAPEAMARAALEVARQGYPAIKVKLGTSHSDDVARIRAIREAVGDEIPLRIDANQGWEVVTAVQILRDLSRFNIQYCEQPVAHWDVDGLQRVRAASPIPIMADESLFDHHDAFRLAKLGACDYLNIKLAKCGGIHSALKIEAIAEGAGIQCMLGCMWETRLALSAGAHLVSARRNIAFADLDGATGHSHDPVSGGIVYEAGRIHLPDTPGHGADIKPGILEALEGVSIVI